MSVSAEGGPRPPHPALRSVEGRAPHPSHARGGTRQGATGRGRRAIATVCLSGTLEDKLVAAAAAGFDGIEIFEPDLIAAPRLKSKNLARFALCGDSVETQHPCWRV